MGKRAIRQSIGRIFGRKSAKSFTGWIAYLDIYGFRSHLESDFFPETEEDLLKLHEKLSQNTTFNCAGSYFMFSDSIALWHDGLTNPDQRLEHFIERIAITQHIAAEFGFLLRGSLAHGRILIAPNYILGDAYLRAYSFESKSLVGPDVVIPELELESAKIADLYRQDLKKIQLKTGDEANVVILQFVNWDEIVRIKRANVAAIMSSDLPQSRKDELAARWESIKER
jgi:hypothetical protein